MRSAVVLLILLAVLWPSGSAAQTDYSLRIRSLDVRFAGLLDDFLTDVYLNPARVSRVERPIVYAVMIPGRGIDCPFPMLEDVGSGLWVETDYGAFSFSIEPVGLGVFGSVKGKVGIALGAEIGLDATESWNEYSRLREAGSGMSLDAYGSGGSSDREHYVLDLAVAPLKHGDAFGIRIKGLYDRCDGNYLRVDHDLGWRLTDPANPFERYISDRSGGRYERLGLSVSAGLSRGDAFLRDAVAGATYIDETARGQDCYVSVLDEDPDGNGVPHPDYSFESSYGTTTVNSDRDYTGFGGFLRAHLGWTERVRSVLSASWTRSSGDGGAAVHEEFQDPTSSTEQRLTYDYDGTVDRIQAECSVGYHEMPFDDVLVAFAAHGYFSRTSFEEDAEGDLSVYRSAAGGSYASPYRQRHDDVNDVYRLTLPIGVEWSFHKYAKIRVGGVLYAQRTKTAIVLTNNAEEMLESGGDAVEFEFDPQRESHESTVGARFNNGLEININDRLIVDLASSFASYSLDLARYYYFSARFVF